MGKVISSIKISWYSAANQRLGLSTHLGPRPAALTRARLLVKTVDVISRNPRPPCKMEYIHYVATTLVILLLIVARHDIHVASFLSFRLSLISDMSSPFCVLPQAT